MDEDMTSDLVISEETPASKSPEPKFFSDKTEEIINSSNLIENQTTSPGNIQGGSLLLILICNLSRI